MTSSTKGTGKSSKRSLRPGAAVKFPAIVTPKPVTTGYQTVTIGGITNGPLHRQKMSSEGPTERTLCGAWPGKAIPAQLIELAVAAVPFGNGRCPVCFPAGEALS